MATINTAVITILRWLDSNLEKWILVIAFSFCSAIVAVEVFRRFFFDVQAPWTTTVPAYLFLWLTWLGAAYCVKTRAHLRFDEMRARMSNQMQFALLMLDYTLYFIFGILVIYWSYDLLALQIMMGSTIPGTTSVPAWWFYSATPIGFSVLLIRVVQCLIEDIQRLRNGQSMLIKSESLSRDSI